jgi:hypothetical protein
MTTLAATATPAGLAALAPATAAELAARIAIPRRLPPRYDGQPMRHLSNSSYTRFLLCPEDWRRHYLLGERFAPSGAMFLGNRVDGALSLDYRHILEHNERLSVEQVRDAYRDNWTRDLQAERDQRGVTWEEDLDEQAAFQIGLDAIDLTFAELVPRIGEPVAVQRRLEFALTPAVDWTVSATWTSRRCARTKPRAPPPRSSTTRSRAAPCHRTRPTTTRRRASTSSAAGFTATPRATSPSRRSPSPAADANR